MKALVWRLDKKSKAYDVVNAVDIGLICTRAFELMIVQTGGKPKFYGIILVCTHIKIPGACYYSSYRILKII